MYIYAQMCICVVYEFAHILMILEITIYMIYTYIQILWQYIARYSSRQKYHTEQLGPGPIP